MGVHIFIQKSFSSYGMGSYGIIIKQLLNVNDSKSTCMLYCSFYKKLDKSAFTYSQYINNMDIVCDWFYHC